MLNMLNASVWEYLKENIVLTVVLAVILALIVTLCGIMIYLQVRAKRNEKTEPTAANDALESTPAPQENAEPAAEEVQEPAPEKMQEEVKEEPAPEEVKETVTEEPAAEEVKETVAEEPAAEDAQEQGSEEPKPVKKEKAEPTVKIAEKKPTPAKKPAAKKPIKVEVKKEDERPMGFQDGKWVIRKTDSGKYAFKLFASNGGLMLESSKEYSSLTTAKQGIETYKKNFADGNCTIVSPKSGHFVYRLTNANGMLLAVSPSYTSKSSCENALENTKRYAKNAPVEVN